MVRDSQLQTLSRERLSQLEHAFGAKEPPGHGCERKFNLRRQAALTKIAGSKRVYSPNSHVRTSDFVA